MEGRLLIPRLGISGNISWLVDTGADGSLLNPNDGQRLQLDYSRLTGDNSATGIGGEMHCFVEPAVLVFTDPGTRLYVYMFDLDISAPDPGISDLPSLLGRDIIDQWRVTYDPANDLLEFEVHSASVQVPLTVP